jgi:hypothetical protein
MTITSTPVNPKIRLGKAKKDDEIKETMIIKRHLKNLHPILISLLNSILPTVTTKQCIFTADGRYTFFTGNFG